MIFKTRKSKNGVTAIAIICLLTLAFTVQASRTADTRTARVGSPTTASTRRFTSPVAADPMNYGTTAVANFIAGIKQADDERILEAQRAEEAARQAVRVVTPVQQPVPVVTNWPTSLYPCGGDLPPCYVKQRESGGSYSARNNESAGSACGAWQIIGSTWNYFGGYPDACSAPPAVQDEKARQLWANGAGCSHWSAC